MEKSRRRSLSSRIDILVVLLILLGKVAFPNKIFAQEAKTKHSIEFILPYYHFLDGSEMKVRYSLARKSFAMGLGIGYSVTVQNTHTFTLSATRFYAGYSEQSRVPPGKIFNREVNQIRLSYGRRLIHKPRFALSAVGGLVFRGGEEEIVWAYPQWFEILTRSHVLRDLGLQAGLRAEYTFLRHMHLSLETNYTVFLLRHDRGQPPHGFDRGSTIHQLGLNVGLGFTFGKRRFEEGGE